MAKPEVVTPEQWAAARAELLEAEKEATRVMDKVAAKRRRLPMVEFSNDYVFDSPSGPKSLLDLFEGRPQLAVYQFMDNGPGKFCDGCTIFTNNVPDHALKMLANCGVSWANVSNMPVSQIEEYKAKQGWTMPFVSSKDTSFAADCGTKYFMFSMFLRDGDKIYRTYSTVARGVDRICFLSNILDLSVYGRQQEWEDSPAGWPQYPTYGRSPL